MDDKIIQYIIVRKDLNMRKGKMIAQGAHASMKLFFDKTLYFDHEVDQAKQPYKYTRALDMTPEMHEWLEGSFTKITLGCDSEEDLLKMYEEAMCRNFPCSLIKDNGLTEFNGVPTYTAIAIGPCWKSDMVDIVAHLKLL